MYPCDGFSLDLLCAQLDDLVTELASAGQRPVVFGVSFGAGIVLEWLRRRRLAGAEPALAGVVLVSPVACVADVVAPDAVKPATLLGRAVRPYLDPEVPPTEAAVERSRMVFTRMFEAGAQNKSALRRLMTVGELERLRSSVLGTIRSITARGARERMQAMTAMKSPTDYFLPGLLPLTNAPALVLFAEREEAVLEARAPTVFAFKNAHCAYFPQGRVQEVRARAGEAPVQHASLIFHVFEFLPPLQAFYARMRALPLPLAA
jgi:pimeloyl-ACP methyl ester carboxylesterase